MKGLLGTMRNLQEKKHIEDKILQSQKLKPDARGSAKKRENTATLKDTKKSLVSI